VERCLGLLCQTLSRSALALQHFEKSVQSERRSFAHLPLAYTLRDYAAALLATDDLASHSAALRYLEEAEAFARERSLPALSTTLRASRARIRCEVEL